ncbi:ABC transporter substrate-binding protein [Marinobacteraceae bacterium S3BR75-40.1]
MRFLFPILLLWPLILGAAPPNPQNLSISLLVASGEQRSVFHRLSERFEERHPGVKVHWLARKDADYKNKLSEWLKDPEGPDVVYWQAGTRLRQIVQSGHLAAIDDLWENEGFDSAYTSGVKQSVSYQGRVYAIPYSYYQWGFYYRQSLFDELGLTPPATWHEFLNLCDALNTAGIAPVTIGTKYHWPAAAWFDYIDLRLNGRQFHLDVTSGKVPFTDSRVRDVFRHWKELLDHDCFIPARLQAQKDWKGALPFLYHNMAALMLMGNYLVPQLPESLRNDIRFFPFPTINAEIGDYEEAPTDVFALPRRSQDNPQARAFLAFIGSAGPQTLLNNHIGKISTNLNAQVGDDYFIREGTKLLEQADGLTQFFDRDAPKVIADEALEAFSAFMAHGDVERTIQRLEEARQEWLADQGG